MPKMPRRLAATTMILVIDDPVVDGGTAVIVLDKVLEVCANWNVGGAVGRSLQASTVAIFPW